MGFFSGVYGLALKSRRESFWEELGLLEDCGMHLGVLGVTSM